MFAILYLNIIKLFCSILKFKFVLITFSLHKTKFPLNHNKLNKVCKYKMEKIK